MKSFRVNQQRRANNQKVALRAKLQASYAQQDTLVQQQQVLLAELDHLYLELMHVALIDAMTGLPNYRAVMSRLEEAITQYQRTGGSCALLVVDLNHFKHVNDTWGHQAGDSVLQQVAQRLRTALGWEDFVGRYGGEEFVILLPQVERQAIKQTAEYLCSVIVSPPYTWHLNHGSAAVPISLTASIGVAIYPLHGGSSESLLESADRAMYQAKYTGCCVCLADGEMTSPGAMPSLQNEMEYTAEVMVVQALMAATATHDRGTDAHAQRLVQLAEALARQLKRPEEEIHLVRLAALLHDIGKLGIPEATLNKPGPLTEEEWTLIRQHPAVGCQILEQIGGVFGLLTSSVLTHHERWDGGGYPQGLAQEAIPLSARILSVVDSYDAMTMPRPYRRGPLTFVEATTELQRGAGSQYDPQVIEAFLSVLAEQKKQPGPLEGAKAPATSKHPHPSIGATTSQRWQQVAAWREQQLSWQQRRETWQQHHQQLTWHKQERDHQQKLLPEANSKQKEKQ